MGILQNYNIKKKLANKPSRGRNVSIQKSSKFSYYKGESEQKINREGPKGIFKYRLVGLAFNWLSLAVVLALIGYSLILQPNATVKPSNELYRSASDYKREVDILLNSVSSRTKATINENAIEEKLKEKFPELLSVRINMPLIGHQPSIDLLISDPQLILQSSSRKYVINRYGDAVSYLDTMRQQPSATLVIDQTGYITEVGKPVLTMDDIDFLSVLIGQCKAYKVPIKNITLPNRAREVELYTTDRKYVTRFSLNNDAAGQVGEYLAARKKLVGYKSPSKYLDVRVVGKIYYR